jgi:hypothetical protein
MPAHSLDLADPKAVARLLVSACLEHGGELRIKALTYDTIDKGRAMIVDFDRATSEIVIRVTSDLGKVMVVPAENSQWLRPKEEVPRNQAETQATQEVVRRTLRSDEELAELEEQLEKKASLAREVQEGKGTKFRTVPPTTQA